MAQTTERTSIPGESKPAGSSSGTRYFSYDADEAGGFPSPWRAAFPESDPVGYWESFGKRCAMVSSGAGGVVDEETARRVWLSILREYEDYERMGMWIPSEVLEEHRQVAIALGW
ncbi:MAG: hypothetical protein ACRDF4_08630 [Rhabdochlamydiaceae bacterium]